MSEHQNREQWYGNESYNEQEVRARRARRIQEMKRQKARRILLQKCIKVTVPIMAIILVASVIISWKKSNSEEIAFDTAKESSFASAQQDETKMTEYQGTQDNPDEQNDMADSNGQSEAAVNENGQIIYSASTTTDTLSLGNDIVSTNALLIDLESNNILAQKDMNKVISPASMTKVLTVLVAAEQIEEAQLDDTFTITLDITDYGYINDCSSAGFLKDEKVTVRDLFYGTILPSGADAAVGLAVYVAGSHEAFVELMNDKLEALGLSETAHVTNCVGVYDKEHHCTVYDMAMIMEAAIANDLCREVMTAHTYTTSVTDQHPEGIILSNWFLRRIEDQDTGGEVICAKTGYVAQSGNCAVSYAMDNGGKEYVCVTANATSSWKCIYDHAALYKMFAAGAQ